MFAFSFSRYPNFCFSVTIFFIPKSLYLERVNILPSLEIFFCFVLNTKDLDPYIP